MEMTVEIDGILEMSLKTKNASKSREGSLTVRLAAFIYIPEVTPARTALA